MSEIQNVTVLGTGVLGSQIVMQAAYAGKNVVAYDIKQEFLDKLPARWEWMRGHYAKDLSDFTAEKFDDSVGRTPPPPTSPRPSATQTSSSKPSPRTSTSRRRSGATWVRR